MFYLETNDGERFFTGAKSDDKAEFEKIVEAKMGKSSVDMLNDLVADARTEGEESVSFDGYVETDYIFDIASDMHDVLKQLQISMNEPEINKSDVQAYLDELRDLYSKLISI